MPDKLSEPPDNWWRYYMIFAMIIIVALILGNAWQSAADKAYLGSLTPEERKQISDQQAAKTLADQQAAAERDRNITAFLNFPVPLWFVSLTIIVTFWSTRRGRY